MTQEEDDKLKEEIRRMTWINDLLWWSLLTSAVALIILAFTGCAALDQYDRNHAFSYQDAEGRSVSYNLNLRAKGYAK